VITLSMMMVIVLRMILAEVVIPTPAMNATELLKVNWMTMVRFSVPIANITSTVMVIVNHKTEVTVIHVMDLIQTAQLVIMNCMKTAMKTMMEIMSLNTVAAIAHTHLTAMEIARRTLVQIVMNLALNAVNQQNVIMVHNVNMNVKGNVCSVIAMMMMMMYRIVQIVEMIKMLKDQIVMVIIGANTRIVIAVIISLDERNEV
jgi:hypothetical protein